jgi:hypothetical protein
MDGDNSRGPSEGRNRVSAIIITVFLSVFAIAILYILYRQFSGGTDSWRNALLQVLAWNKT